MKLTLEQHRELGETVKRFGETMMQWDLIMDASSKPSVESLAVQRMLSAVNKFKCTMDEVVCCDFPECPDDVWIYYGMSRQWLDKQDVDAGEKEVKKPKRAHEVA
jgi:hypothetical protein